MSVLLKKVWKTYKRYGLKSVVSKSVNRVNAILARRSINNSDNQQKWDALKDKYLGERVFVIGNGPSLNKTPLYLLKDEYKMCFNRFNIMLDRLNWTPDFFLTADDLVLSDIINELDEIVPKTKYSFFPDIHFRGEIFVDKVPAFDNLLWIRQSMGEGFSTKLPNIYPGGTVIYEGFQILYHLGFREIYLVGVDMSYQIHNTAKLLKDKGIEIISQDNDDPNHFDPRYFGKDRKYHQPEPYVILNIIKGLDYIASQLPELKLNITNVGYDSKLESFPRGDLMDLLDKSELEQSELFTECLKRANCQLTIEDFKNQKSKLLNEENWSEELGDFYADLPIALKVIKKAVFTHITIGPFDNKYFFIKRENIQN